MLFRFNPLDLQKHALIRKNLLGLGDLGVNQRLPKDILDPRILGSGNSSYFKTVTFIHLVSTHRRQEKLSLDKRWCSIRANLALCA